MKLDYYFIQNLINKELWLSDPLTFNDPYDCRLSIDLDNTYEEILGDLIEVNKQELSPHDVSFILARAFDCNRIRFKLQG